MSKLVAGRAKTGGRQKGTPNKINSDIKGMILGALSAKGGVKYLEQQADANPVAFMGLVGKVLPLTVAGDPNAPLVAIVNRTICDPNPRNPDS